MLFSILSNIIGYNKCLTANALPEPDFKYRSKSYALYLSGKEQHHINLRGRCGLVAGTYPFL